MTIPQPPFRATLTMAELLPKLVFNDAGLIPVIAQDAVSEAVLMLAWMNQESLEKTLSTGNIWYFSRSRNALWRKGETSGHVQTLEAAYYDCDGDTLLLKVQQVGPACHTNAPSCFFNKI